MSFLFHRIFNGHFLPWKRYFKKFLRPRYSKISLFCPIGQKTVKQHFEILGVIFGSLQFPCGGFNKRLGTSQDIAITERCGKSWDIAGHFCHYGTLWDITGYCHYATSRNVATTGHCETLWDISITWGNYGEMPDLYWTLVRDIVWSPLRDIAGHCYYGTSREFIRHGHPFFWSFLHGNIEREN